MSQDMKLMLDIVIKDLLNMPQEEFKALLESHRNSDIACAIRELNEFETYLQEKADVQS